MKKYKERSVDNSLEFRELSTLPVDEALATLGGIIENIIAGISNRVEGHDMIRTVIRSNLLHNPISLPIVQMLDLSVERILQYIEKVLQSQCAQDSHTMQ